jgi:hypothetical protein
MVNNNEPIEVEESESRRSITLSNGGRLIWIRESSICSNCNCDPFDENCSQCIDYLTLIGEHENPLDFVRGICSECNHEHCICSASSINLDA